MERLDNFILLQLNFWKLPYLELNIKEESATENYLHGLLKYQLCPEYMYGILFPKDIENLI